MAPYRFIERTRCPACGSGSVETLWNSPFTRLRRILDPYYNIDSSCLDGCYRLDECKRCSLVFQRFVGEDRLLVDLYTHWIDQAPTERHFQDLQDYRGSRDAHELFAASSFLKRPLNQMTVLDYGSGWALWPTIAFRLGCTAYATELSERKRVDDVIYLSEEEIGDHRFDFINLEQVIEHVPEPLALVTRLVRSLKPRGILKLSMPNGANARAVIRELEAGTETVESLNPVFPLEHINSFNWRAVDVMAKMTGLRPIRPSIKDWYSFLWSGGIPKRPKPFVREMMRPIWPTPRNLYVWLRPL